MNVVAAGMVGIALMQRGGIGIGTDVAAVAPLYRAIAAGTFKPAAITDAQFASLGRLLNAVAAVASDPAERAGLVKLVQSL